jgi:hypothetical protein
MTVEAPRNVEAPKNASPTDEQLREISERLRNFQYEDLGFNPMNIITILINEALAFNFYKKADDSSKANDSSIKIKKIRK